MDTNNKFGLILKRLREEKLLTQAGLGDLAGFNRTFISMLERGTRNPSLDTVIELAKALDIKAYRIVAEVCGDTIKTEKTLH